ncbi:hypothetical protein T492DRAFT_977065 [Pavlovales sp. CCMP2436]|nr:hypothetical protein T492DRAFT_977065 [Pavlovales sp. CCMP2436]
MPTAGRSREQQGSLDGASSRPPELLSLGPRSPDAPGLQPREQRRSEGYRPLELLCPALESCARPGMNSPNPLIMRGGFGGSARQSLGHASVRPLELHSPGPSSPGASFRRLRQSLGHASVRSLELLLPGPSSPDAPGLHPREQRRSDGQRPIELLSPTHESCARPGTTSPNPLIMRGGFGGNARPGAAGALQLRRTLHGALTPASAVSPSFGRRAKPLAPVLLRAESAFDETTVLAAIGFAHPRSTLQLPQGSVSNKLPRRISINVLVNGPASTSTSPKLNSVPKPRFAAHDWGLAHASEGPILRAEDVRNWASSATSPKVHASRAIGERRLDRTSGDRHVPGDGERRSTSESDEGGLGGGAGLGGAELLGVKLKAGAARGPAEQADGDAASSAEEDAAEAKERLYALEAALEMLETPARCSALSAFETDWANCEPFEAEGGNSEYTLAQHAVHVRYGGLLEQLLVTHLASTGASLGAFSRALICAASTGRCSELRWGVLQRVEAAVDFVAFVVLMVTRAREHPTPRVGRPLASKPGASPHRPAVADLLTGADAVGGVLLAEAVSRETPRDQQWEDLDLSPACFGLSDALQPAQGELPAADRSSTPLLISRRSSGELHSRKESLRSRGHNQELLTAAHVAGSWAQGWADGRNVQGPGAAALADELTRTIAIDRRVAR